MDAGSGEGAAGRVDGPKPEPRRPGNSHEGWKVGDEFGGQRFAAKGRQGGSSGFSSGQSSSKGFPTQHAPTHKATILQSPGQTAYELPSPSSLRCHDHHLHHCFHNRPTEGKHTLSYNPLIQGCFKSTPSTSRISTHPSPSPSIATLLKYLSNPETSTVLKSDPLISQQRKCK